MAIITDNNKKKRKDGIESRAYKALPFMPLLLSHSFVFSCSGVLFQFDSLLEGFEGVLELFLFLKDDLIQANRGCTQQRIKDLQNLLLLQGVDYNDCTVESQLQRRGFAVVGDVLVEVVMVGHNTNINKHCIELF